MSGFEVFFLGGGGGGFCTHILETGPVPVQNTASVFSLG